MFKIGSSIAKITGRTGLKIAKFSPEILLGMGIVGVISAAVMACRATASDHYADIRADHSEMLDKIEKCKKEQSDYTDKDYRMDKVITYRNTAIDMIQLYAPSVGIGFVSIGCILWGHKILKGRNIALMAAYKVIDQSFREYRSRVKEALGEDADKQFLYDTETRSFTKVDMLEDGTTKKSKVTYQVLKGNKVSMYAQLFDEHNNQWVRDPNFNWLYLKKKRDYLNDRLHAVGHVFLNEVYDELGFPHTQAGQVVGWTAREGIGDQYISFGPWCESLEDMVEAGTDSVLLDFNVDGIIWDMI